MKIEPRQPLTEEEIKGFLAEHLAECDDGGDCAPVRTILAWAHAAARAESAEFEHESHAPQPHEHCQKCYWTDADWLAAVLKRIGWNQHDES